MATAYGAVQVDFAPRPRIDTCGGTHLHVTIMLLTKDNLGPPSVVFWICNNRYVPTFLSASLAFLSHVSLVSLVSLVSCHVMRCNVVSCNEKELQEAILKAAPIPPDSTPILVEVQAADKDKKTMSMPSSMTTESVVVPPESPSAIPIAIAVPAEVGRGKGNTASKGKDTKLGRRGATLATRGYQKEAAGEVGFAVLHVCIVMHCLYVLWKF